MGTQFQFCKVKSSRNLLHNKVPTSNTAKSKLVKMVNVRFYHNKKKKLLQQGANKLGYLPSISWLRALTHSTLRGHPCAEIQEAISTCAILGVTFG